MVSASLPPALLVQRLPDRRTVTVGVWLAHGAAHDPERLAGATHLVEHLMLRRCGARARRELARLVDRLGGGVDAWTGAESMGVAVETTVDAIDAACDLVQDAVLDPTFDEGDVDLERRVAGAELDLARSDPEDRVEELLLQAAWGSHPLARPIIGDRLSLGRLTPEVLHCHHGTLVGPGRVLVSVVGDVLGEEMVVRFNRLPLHRPLERPPLPPLSWAAGTAWESARGDQVHARLAFPVRGSGDPDLPTLAVLNRLLGVGASSRLFQRLREDEGLTYDVFSSLLLRRQGGLLEVGWACGRDAYTAARRLVLEELERLPRDLSTDEVAVAVEALSRGLMMDLEDPAARADLEANEVFERGRRLDPARALAKLAQVSAEDARRLAREVLATPRMASAVCGPEGLAELVA